METKDYWHIKKHRRRRVHWVRITLLVLCFFILVIGAGLILINKSNYELKTVISGSMEPSIRTGSVAIVDTTVTEFVNGDIVTYEHGAQNSQSITHRIIETDNEDGGYTTKGDANESPDSWTVFEDNIIGTVSYSIPYLGYIVEFIKSPLGFGVIIIGPAVVIISIELLNIAKQFKNNDKYTTRKRDK